MSIYHTLNKSLCELFDVNPTPIEDYEPNIIPFDGIPHGVGERNGFYGKQHTEEYKKKYSERFKGSNNPNYGKKWTPEMKEAMRQKKLGVTASEETKKKLSEMRKGKPTWNKGLTYTKGNGAKNVAKKQQSG